MSLCGVLLVGCVRGPQTERPRASVDEPRPAEPRTGDPKLLAIADEIDPGPQAPLLDALPTWLKGQMDASLGTTDRAQATREIREALLAWDKQPAAGGDLMARLLALGRGLVLAERAVAAGEDDVELLLALTRVYTILDSPIFASELGIFQQVLQLAGQMAELAAKEAAAAGKPAGAIDVPAVVTSLRDMFRRASALHRRTAALLLRKHGEHPEIARVLANLGEDALRREQYPRAIELRRMSLARLGTRATAADHIDMARTCHRALDLACGDAELERGKVFTGDAKATKDHAQRIEYAEKTAKQARRVVELAAADPNDLTLALERGHDLVLLDRFTDAEALYKRLMAAHPEDARPHAGLAKLSVQRVGDFTAASKHVAAGKALANKDRDFYEVALGTIGVNFLYDALPRLMRGENFQLLVVPMLLDLRNYVAGLRSFDPARAAVVEVIEAGVEGAVPAFLRGDQNAAVKALRGLLASAAPVAAKFPDSPDAWRLRTAATYFAATAKPALAAMRAPLSAKLASDPALQRARVQSWLDVALAFEEAGELTALASAAEGLSVVDGDSARATLQAAVLAIQFRRSGDRAAGERAAQIYAGLAESGSDEARAIALNNLGVLRARLGDVQQSIDLLAQALTLDRKAGVPLLNLAAIVMTAENGQRPELLDAFASVLRDGATATLRLQAAAWSFAQAQRGGGDVEVARAAFVAALKSSREAEVRGTLPLGRWGLISTGNFQINFVYSVPSGFQIKNEVVTSLWLIEPAPDLDALVAGKPLKPLKP